MAPRNDSDDGAVTKKMHAGSPFDRDARVREQAHLAAQCDKLYADLLDAGLKAGLLVARRGAIPEYPPTPSRARVQSFRSRPRDNLRWEIGYQGADDQPEDFAAASAANAHF